MMDIRVQIDREGVFRRLIGRQSAVHSLDQCQLARLAGVGECSGRLGRGNLVVRNVAVGSCRAVLRHLGGEPVCCRFCDGPVSVDRDAGQADGITAVHGDGGCAVREGVAAVGAGELLGAHGQFHGEREELAAVSGVVAHDRLVDFQLAGLAGIGERRGGGHVVLEGRAPSFAGLCEYIVLFIRQVFSNGVLYADGQAADRHGLAMLELEARSKDRAGARTGQGTGHAVLEVQVAVLAGDAGRMINVLAQHQRVVKQDVIIGGHVADDLLADHQAAVLAGVGEGGNRLDRGNGACVAGPGHRDAVRGRFGHGVTHTGGQAGDVELLAVLQREGIGALAISGNRSNLGRRRIAGLLYLNAGQYLVKLDCEVIIGRLIRVDRAGNSLGNLQFAGLAGVGVSRGSNLIPFCRLILDRAGHFQLIRGEVAVRSLEHGVGHLRRHTLDGNRCAALQRDHGPAVGEVHGIGARRGLFGLPVGAAHLRSVRGYSLEVAVQVAVEGDGVMELSILIRGDGADNRLAQDDVVQLADVGRGHLDRRRSVRHGDTLIILHRAGKAAGLNVGHDLGHDIMDARRQAFQLQLVAGLYEEVRACAALEVTSGDSRCNVRAVAILIQIVQLHVELEGSRLIHVQRAGNDLLQGQLTGFAGVDKFRQVRAVNADGAAIAQFGHSEVGRSVTFFVFCHCIRRAFGQMLDHQDLAMLQVEVILAVGVGRQILHGFSGNICAALDDRAGKYFIGHRGSRASHAVQRQGESEFLGLVVLQIGENFLADDEAGLGACVGECRHAGAGGRDDAGFAGVGRGETSLGGLCHSVPQACGQLSSLNVLAVMQGKFSIRPLNLRDVSHHFGFGLEGHAAKGLAVGICDAQVGRRSAVRLEQLHGEGEVLSQVARLVAVHRLGHFQAALGAGVGEGIGHAVFQNHCADGGFSHGEAAGHVFIYMEGRADRQAHDDRLAASLDRHSRFALDKVDVSCAGRCCGVLGIIVLDDIGIIRQLGLVQQPDSEAVSGILIRRNIADDRLVDGQIRQLAGVFEGADIAGVSRCRLHDNQLLCRRSRIGRFGVEIAIRSFLDIVLITGRDAADRHGLVMGQIDRCGAVFEGYLPFTAQIRAMLAGLGQGTHEDSACRIAVCILHGDGEGKALGAFLIRLDTADNLLGDLQAAFILGVNDRQNRVGLEGLACGACRAIVSHGEAFVVGFNDGIGDASRQSLSRLGLAVLDSGFRFTGGETKVAVVTCNRCIAQGNGHLEALGLVGSQAGNNALGNGQIRRIPGIGEFRHGCRILHDGTGVIFLVGSREVCGRSFSHFVGHAGGQALNGQGLIRLELDIRRVDAIAEADAAGHSRRFAASGLDGCFIRAGERRIAQLHLEGELGVRVAGQRPDHSLVDGQIAGVMCVGVFEGKDNAVLGDFGNCAFPGYVAVRQGQCRYCTFTHLDRRAGQMVARHHHAGGILCHFIVAQRQVGELIVGKHAGRVLSEPHQIHCLGLKDLLGFGCILVARHGEVQVLHIRVRGQAVDLLDDGQLAPLQSVLDRADAGRAFIGGEVVIVADLNAAGSLQRIAGAGQVGDFLPEVAVFLSFRVLLVNSQRHDGPVVVFVQLSLLDLIAGSRRLEGNLLQVRSRRSSGHGRAVQLNLDLSRPQRAVTLVVPDLQYSQAELIRIIGIGNGSQAAGDNTVGILGISCGQAGHAVAGNGQSIAFADLFDPAPDNLVTVLVLGQAGNSSGVVTFLISGIARRPGCRSPLIGYVIGLRIRTGADRDGLSGYVGALVARLLFRIQDHFRAIHSFIVLHQLRSDALRTFAVLVVLVVPDLHHLRNSLSGRIAVGDGPFAVRFAFIIDIRFNIHSVGRAVEGDGGLAAFSDRAFFLHEIVDRCERGSDVFNRRQVSKRIGPLVGHAKNSFRNRAFGSVDFLQQFHGNGIRPFTVIVVIVVPDLPDRDLSRNVGVGNRDLTLRSFPFRCADQIIGIRAVFHRDAGNLQVVLLRAVVPGNRHGHFLGRRVIGHARGGAAGFGNVIGISSGLSKGNRIKYLRFVALHGNCADCLSIRILSIRISQRDGKGLVSGICTGDNLLHRDLSSRVAVYQLGEEDQLDAILFSGLRRLRSTDDILIGVSGSAVSLLTRDDDLLTGRVSGTTGAVGFHPAVAVAVSAGVFLIHANGHSGPVISLGQLDDLMSSSIGIR